jgi:hypothetical protein
VDKAGQGESFKFLSVVAKPEPTFVAKMSR